MGGIAEDLFQLHASSSPGAVDGGDPWQAVFGSTVDEQGRPKQEGFTVQADALQKYPPTYWQADGVLVLGRSLTHQDPALDNATVPLGRHVYLLPQYGWQASTRLTCLRVSHLVCRFALPHSISGTRMLSK